MTDLNRLYTLFANDCAETPLEQRGPVMEVHLAKQVAYRLPIPSAPMDGLASYYTTNHAPLAKQMVSTFNEKCPIDVHNTLELIHRLWRFRYNLCHSANVLKLETFLSGFEHELAPRYVEIAQCCEHLGIRGTISEFLDDRFSS